MVKRTGGFRRKTRHQLKKNVRTRGKISITRYFQKFEEGEKVILAAEPAVQKGMYFPRFHGKFGVIKNRLGRCYEVSIKDGNKTKIIITHAIHLKKAK